LLNNFGVNILVWLNLFVYWSQFMSTYSAITFERVERFFNVNHIETERTLQPILVKLTLRGQILCHHN